MTEPVIELLHQLGSCDVEIKPAADIVREMMDQAAQIMKGYARK